MKKIRVRFAPSPTGALHVGGIRTALYNYLLARKLGGTMILRIEDTDRSRFIPKAEQYILDSLQWVGIQIDEGVGVGGPYAPYRQSERGNIYKEYAQKLINTGNAYYAFDTEADLETMRQRTPNAQYDSVTRLEMNNSLSLPGDEVKNKLAAGDSYVIRIKIPPNEEVSLSDLIRGEVKVVSTQLDDKVLMKSDGMPTYHLANVVDDYLMKISHVIRGEEWLPSTPLHVLIYKFLGWENEMPEFAHLPLLLKPDGNGKLSKRDADRMGFPIFPLHWTDPVTGESSIGFRDAGYLPEALINFLALLGWNPGTPQELFSLPELVDAFTLERVGKAGAKFDIQKAQWFNQHYLRAKTNEELVSYLLETLRSENIICPEPKLIQIIEALRDRVTFPKDFWEQGKVFFQSPKTFDATAVSKKWNKEAIQVLTHFAKGIKSITIFTAESAKLTLDAVALEQGIKTGNILAALRIALTGGMSGPDLMQTMEILGNEETSKRIAFALATIPRKD